MDYSIKRFLDKLNRGEATGFLDPLEYKMITLKLKKNQYQTYNVYPDADRKILYVNSVPSIKLFKVNVSTKLRHQDIMGALYSLNLDKNVFGDIIIDEDNYFFYVLDNMSFYVKNNLCMIGNSSITLEEVSLNVFDNYNRKYEVLSIVVPSLRIDAVISKIIGTSRKNMLEIIKNKEVILNYSILKNESVLLKPGDVFSIRKYGKYKFSNVLKSTKKDNIIIEYFKYI